MWRRDLVFKDELLLQLREAVSSDQPVSGLTHDFYRYPARFSPLFARVAMETFTRPGDMVLDPFMGGGTTLVEARVLGRRAVGIDISELATFVSRVKTTVLSGEDLSTIRDWACGLPRRLNLRNIVPRSGRWAEDGYMRNINGRKTWRIRKTLELALAETERLPQERQQDFARCALLRTGQWALDCRSVIPRVEDFRDRLLVNLAQMSVGMGEFSSRAKEADRLYDSCGMSRVLCLNRSAVGIESEQALGDMPPPRLILTSPPYPGVHVLYHRWQVQGRRETPAPFWVARCRDGHGASYYSSGHREQRGLVDYYRCMYGAFTSVARIARRGTLLIQILAFSDPSWQLTRYLQLLEQVGFAELRPPGLANSPDGRMWRRVPNRKWYADQKGTTSSSNEVILFHHLA